MRRKNASGRALTVAEIALAQRVFGERIDYGRVRLVNGKYMALQLPQRVMAPNGNIYWPDACPDLASCGHPRCRDTFIHEMAHVMQHQQGVRVFWHGLWLHGARVLSCGRFNPYRCVVKKGKPFCAYNIEQQAELAVEMLHGRYPRKF
ncbi:MAG: hypothetical protein ABW110_12305 [Steroidobacteraceae bacterium]